MLLKTRASIPSSEITDERLYVNRRQFIQSAATIAAGAAAMTIAPGSPAVGPADAQTALANVKPSPFSTDEKQNPLQDIAGYNNYYEFGLDKSDPARNAGKLKTYPWTVKVDGQVAKPTEFHIEDLLKFPLEERVYRMRCVEAWSMFIPWVGFPLSEVLKRVEPTAKAKYVAFTTLNRPSEMPGQMGSALDWPYVEGLRLDEAMHPLTILSVGMYGKTLLNQNGAPIRLVVP